MTRKQITSGFIHCLSLIALVLALVLRASPVVAATLPAARNTSAQIKMPNGGPSNPQEVEAFLDGVLARQMADYHIPGATVALVKDGALLLAKGYGYADLEEQQAVVADQTLFRVGS